MVQFKKKNAGDTGVSVRLFDVEVDHFNPTLPGSARFSQIVVKISSLAPGQIGRFCLNLKQSGCCAAKLSNEYGA